MPHRAALLGIDVGGTTAKGLLVSPRGDVLARDAAPTGEGEGAVQRVVDLAARLGGVAGVDVVAGGLISPGMISPDAATVTFASNLGWRDVPLAARVAEVLGAPVRLANDATSAGLAEGRLGVARGVEDFVHLAIGTGVGASVVVGGRALYGTFGTAGEIGHATVVPGGERCPCGRVGCLDAYAAAGGMLRRYRERTGEGLSGVDALLARVGQDPVAATVWAEALDALAAAIVTAVMTLDPALVVLGGGVARAGEALRGPVAARVAESLVWKPAPPIRLSALGSMAGYAGALSVGLLGLEPEVRADWPLDRLLEARA